MRTFVIFAIAAFALAACTKTTTTTLKNPKTGEKVTCTGETVDPLLVGGMMSLDISTKDDSSCIEKYRSQGYERDSAIGSIF